MIGTSGWSYADWQGKFYPPKCPKSRWLEFYATEFMTVEINATFYRSFNSKIYTQWRERVPHDFIYVIKVPRIITHREYLENCETDIYNFCQASNFLKTKLGLYLLQLPANMPYDLQRIKNALLSFDDPTRVAVEFRHSKWFNTDVKALLLELKCVFCAVDSSQYQLLNWQTSDIAYVRLHGREHGYHYDYSNAELNEIANFVRKLGRQGVKLIYIFFNNDYQAKAPKNARELAKLLSDIII